MKLILNDGTEHEVRSGTLPGTITMEIETYGDIQRLEESLLKSGNLDQVILGEQTAENLALLTDMHFSAGRKNDITAAGADLINTLLLVVLKTSYHILLFCSISFIQKVACS